MAGSAPPVLCAGKPVTGQHRAQSQAGKAHAGVEEERTAGHSAASTGMNRVEGHGEISASH